MKSDISSGAPPPPPKKTTIGTAVSSTVATMSVAQLETELERVLTSVLPKQPLNEIAADNSPSIPSLISVWLISQVGEVVGRPKLVKLNGVDKKELRSLGGVARVVHSALQTFSPATVAS